MKNTYMVEQLEAEIFRLSQQDFTADTDENRGLIEELEEELEGYKNRI